MSKKTDNKQITLGELLETWVEEDLKAGSMSNGTVELYQNIVKVIKRHPICASSIRTITSEQLQCFMDQITFGGREGDFDSGDGYSPEYAKKPYAVLNHAFRFAVFPKKYISFNPMQYVVIHKRNINVDIFGGTSGMGNNITPITHTMYEELISYLEDHHPDAVLPVQIAYYSGLRIGEVCGLVWQDINLDEQYLTVRRSITYDSQRHRIQIGTTKRAKIRTVDFGDTLAAILMDANERIAINENLYGSNYNKCYYREIREQNRVYYEYYHYNMNEDVPGDCHELDFVCKRKNGNLIRPGMIKTICWHISKELPGFENFHFHVLRHTYTTNLLANGAMPKDVQELLGHSAVSTTMDIYAHATRASKISTARLLDIPFTS